MDVIAMIEEQQKGKENTPEWMIGEQLKDICRREQESGAIIGKDFGIITLEKVAGKLKAKADELHRKQKGSCVCITPMVAEEIIREAYGLPGAVPEKAPKQQNIDSDFLDLADFL